MFNDLNFSLGEHKVYTGDANLLLDSIDAESIDIVITSPPYWGQRTSLGLGVEEDPRFYVKNIVKIFLKIHRTLKSSGLLWLNIGDSYNTPVNWEKSDYKYSTLGAGKNGLSPNNSVYIKNRSKRRAFIEKGTNWLKYGNLLGLPYRIILSLVDEGYYFRGEIIWKKLNPVPEGRCRRPHRVHEPIYLLSKREDHPFLVKPPVKSVWEFPNEGRKEEKAHFSRFPEELPKRCILSSGVKLDKKTLIMDPFTGSGTTGVVAKKLGCSFIGFEIDNNHAQSANTRIQEALIEPLLINGRFG